MWSHEHAVEAEVSAEAVWDIWADVAGWGDWNPDIAAIAIDGPFAVGSTISMTPRGGEPVALSITELDPGGLFVDQAELGGAVITTTHRVERLSGDLVRIVYRTEITGPAAEEVGPRIGPAITGDFPETMAALVSLAAR